MCPFKQLSELVLKCDTGINLSESCCGGVEPPLMEILDGWRYLPRHYAESWWSLIPEHTEVSGIRGRMSGGYRDAEDLGWHVLYV